MMRKTVLFLTSALLAVLMVFSLTACGKKGGNDGGGTKPGATVTLNKTELTLNEGETERLVATTDPQDESITFSSSNPSVATITLTGLVSALSGGTTTITATVTSSGNTATCTVTVNEQTVSIPTGSDIIRIDKNQDFERVVPESVNGLTISRSNDITTLTYTPEIVLKNDWSNQVSLNLEGIDLTRSTKLGFNFKGNQEDVFVLVYDESTATILQQTFKTTAGWNTYEVNIPKATRHLMAKAKRVCVTVPVPSTKYKGEGGTVQIGGLWFAGDAEPSVLKTYDYSKYEVMASLDLSKWNSATFKDTFQGNTTVENGNTSITGTYNEEDGSLTLVNKGYSKWISFPMSVPAGDYSDAECIAIKAKGTAGAAIAGQVQWKEAYEMNKFTSEAKYHFADISEYPISEKGGYVSFAPCKFNSGYTEWELTIYSIEILKPLPEGAKPAPQPEASADIPEGVTRLDENQDFTKNPEYKGSMTIKKTETVTEIWLQSAGIREGNGKNSVRLSLKDYAVSGATDLCFRIKGNGDKVVVNLTTADGDEILSEKVRTFVSWSLYKLVIPEEKRALLNDKAILSFTVPEYNPDYKVQGGCYVYFDGVWFNGGVESEPEQYTVTFASNGGSAVDPATVTEGNKVTKPTDPTKDGYTFDGWYKEEGCTNAWNFDTDTVTANTTLYAKWTVVPNEGEYLVTFNSLGGSAVTAVTVAEGNKVTEPADPTKAGHTFDGWYKEEGCTNAWNFETDTVTENTTLYAKWIKNPEPGIPTDAVRVDENQSFVKSIKQSTYMEVKKAEDGVTTVTVKGQALKATDESNYVSLSLSAINVSDATKITLNVKGYWFKEVNKENVLQEGTVKITVKLLTADGTAIMSETVTLTSEGSVLEIDIPADKKDALATATSIMFVVPTHESDPATGVRANVEFSGVWIDGEVKAPEPEPEQYTVTFNSLGGSAVDPATVTEGGKVTKPTDPTKAGHTFDGWYKEESCTNAWDFENDTVTANTTLYAKWTENAPPVEGEYLVTFNSLGGSAVASVTVEEGGKIAKPADPTKAGHTFDGWYKEEGCTNAWDFETDTVTENTTLYAKWTANAVTPNPDEPTDMVRVDEKQSFVKNSNCSQKTAITVSKANDGVTTVKVIGQALKLTDESNYVSLSLSDIDVSDATKITLKVKGYWTNNTDVKQEGMSLNFKVKLLATDGTVIVEQTVEITADGDDIEIEIPADKKDALTTAASIAFVVPLHGGTDPAQGMRAYVEFSGVWIDGVAKTVDSAATAE